ncbi:MAG: hypothetical protein PVG03_06130 [Desulfarculaceae bacterium]|jgi:hypothetical protein
MIPSSVGWPLGIAFFITNPHFSGLGKGCNTLLYLSRSLLREY